MPPRKTKMLKNHILKLLKLLPKIKKLTKKLMMLRSLPRKQLMRQLRKLLSLLRLKMLLINKLLKLKKPPRLLKNQMLLHSRRIRQRQKLTRPIKQRKTPKRHLMMLHINLKPLTRLTLTLIKKLLKQLKPMRKLLPQNLKPI